jgi:uncharacterized LabA/DUF88 family protein
MDALTALAERLTHALVAWFTAAPLLWALLVLLMLVGLGVVALRRHRPRNEIDTFYLASAASIRKAREIGEIDAFARRAGAVADEMKAQIRKLRSGHYSQVKIYVDHSNFISSWNDVAHKGERTLSHDINWHLLPQLLMDETTEWLKNARKAPQAVLYRGMHVYGTLFEDAYFALLETMLRYEQSAPDKLSLPIRLRQETIDKWRAENEAYKLELTREIGSVTGCTMVPIYRRTPREDQLSRCQYTSGGIPIAPEKMLDTHVATDLIGDAVFDAYDIALLVSEDSDFVPAVQFAHEIRGKQVVHVGFGSHANELRTACRFRIDLARNDLCRRLQRKV